MVTRAPCLATCVVRLDAKIPLAEERLLSELVDDKLAPAPSGVSTPTSSPCEQGRQWPTEAPLDR